MMEPDHHRATAPCDSCASFVADGAQFCGTCGRSLALAGAHAPTTTLLRAVPHDPTEAPPAEPATNPKRWRRWATIGAGVVLVLALIGFAARTHLDTREDLSDTRAQLASTSETLADTEDTLAETSAELEDTSAVLADTKQQLRTRTSERDALQGEVEGLETDLEGVRGSLANAEQRITLQSGEITNLRSCLQGVSNALFYLADGYFSAALGAIEAVEVSCNAAMESL